MNPIEIANPQLFRRSVSEDGQNIGYVPVTQEEIWQKPVEPLTLTKSEKAWAGLIIGLVGTAILITAGFVDGQLQAVLFAIGGLVNTLGVRLGVFQVANSEVKL